MKFSDIKDMIKPFKTIKSLALLPALALGLWGAIAFADVMATTGTTSINGFLGAISSMVMLCTGTIVAGMIATKILDDSKGRHAVNEPLMEGLSQLSSMPGSSFSFNVVSQRPGRVELWTNVSGATRVLVDESGFWERPGNKFFHNPQAIQAGLEDIKQKAKAQLLIP